MFPTSFSQSLFCFHLALLRHSPVPLFLSLRGQRGPPRSHSLYPVAIKELIFLHTAAYGRAAGSDGRFVPRGSLWAICGMRRMPTYQAVFWEMAWGGGRRTRRRKRGGSQHQNSLASQGWAACAQRGFYEPSIESGEVLGRFSAVLQLFSFPWRVLIGLATRHRVSHVCVSPCVYVSHVC